MSESSTELPDPVYGSADVNRGDCRRLSTSSTTTPTATLLHAHIGPIYIAMTERNWRALFHSIEQLDVPVPTYRIHFNDDQATATIAEVTR